MSRFVHLHIELYAWIDKARPVALGYSKLEYLESLSPKIRRLHDSQTYLMGKPCTKSVLEQHRPLRRILNNDRILGADVARVAGN